ncbi:PRTRC system protein B (plasmid) [Deinococcus sp. KNUC1210]|uniref:PRTRC system protein B n=1 Tax=Deinococcus sp. KNUC1210 TaxID=2917691 RepID=UPI001EF02F59|nr:PRTRC system protein B [Deinococcus sp. KNUC1210]ULH18113.1 PRTRC system protein B [Deinococcus sp. KNUC1210]
MPPAVFQPQRALVLYHPPHGQAVHVLSHPIQDEAHGFTLGAGAVLTSEDVAALLDLVAGQGMTLLAPNTLATGPGSVCWWVPPGVRALRFDPKYAATAQIAVLNGQLIPHPGLVLQATSGKLCVFAVWGMERPTASTMLHHAPFWNLYADGRMCQGTVAYPATQRPQDQTAWEDALFGSYFTGPSRTDTYTQWGRSYQELLEQALADGRFPQEVLMPSVWTLGQYLGVS